MTSKSAELIDIITQEFSIYILYTEPSLPKYNLGQS